jgi:hypothetical protein
MTKAKSGAWPTGSGRARWSAALASVAAPANPAALMVTTAKGPTARAAIVASLDWVGRQRSPSSSPTCGYSRFPAGFTSSQPVDATPPAPCCDRASRFRPFVCKRPALAIDYGVSGVPESFFMDAAGIVRYKQWGPVTRAVLEAQLPTLVSDVRVPSD